VLDSDEVTFIVVGAGMAGAKASAVLPERGRVALVEQAGTSGHHATGRSASVLSKTSGQWIMCALAVASRSFL
jgi:D-arginine dehydrogenase